MNQTETTQLVGDGRGHGYGDWESFYHSESNLYDHNGFGYGNGYSDGCGDGCGSGYYTNGNGYGLGYSTPWFVGRDCESD